MSESTPTHAGRIESARHALTYSAAIFPFMRSMLDYKTQPEQSGSGRTKRTKAGNAPLNLRVVDTTTAVETWLSSVVARLVAETGWHPPLGADTPTLLIAIVEERIGYALDPIDGMKFVQDASRHMYKVNAVTTMGGAYWRSTGERGTCPHTLDEGERCENALEMLSTSVTRTIPVLRCTTGCDPVTGRADHPHMVDVGYFPQMTSYYEPDAVVEQMHRAYLEMWEKQQQEAAA
jgi:hypothetical protein